MNRILVGDVVSGLAQLPNGCVQTCVTSPPYYGLRDYGVAGQIGLEPTPEEFIARMVEVFRAVHRVLRPDGTVWMNMGDSYAGGGGGNYSKSEKQTPHGSHPTNIRNRQDWLERAAVKPKDFRPNGELSKALRAVLDGHLFSSYQGLSNALRDVSSLQASLTSVVDALGINRE